MINFYKFYNKRGLDSEHYIPLIQHIINLPKIVHKISHIEIGHRFKDINFKPGENIIKKSPQTAYYYARFILNGRFIEAEPYLMKDLYYAFYYAQDILKCRWPEAESMIKEHPGPWEHYCAVFNMSV